MYTVTFYHRNLHLTLGFATGTLHCFAVRFVVKFSVHCVLLVSLNCDFTTGIL